VKYAIAIFSAIFSPICTEINQTKEALIIVHSHSNHFRIIVHVILMHLFC